ncbi:MAG: DNA recombination protein RecN [Campylobacterales bacterium]
MIERITIKEAVTFKTAELRPEAGLNIFSGPSGAGKSVLMGTVLALFGLKESEAALAEAVLQGVKLPDDLPVEEGDDVIVRQIKKEKVRFFINDSQISRPALKNAFEGRVRYLNHKETGDLSSQSLLDLLDLLASGNNAAYGDRLAVYKTRFAAYETQKAELAELKAREAKAQELKEFARFEIEKIESVNPKPGEYEKLLELKKRLSKKEKIGQLMGEAAAFKEHESRVFELYELLGIDATAFTEAMNELSGVLENGASEMEEMEGTDPEVLLERIEKLSGLIRRFGGVEEAIEHAKTKKAELAGFESIEADIKRLEKAVGAEEAALTQEAEAIAAERKKAAKPLEEKVSAYLKQLYLPAARITLEQTALNLQAGQKAGLELSGVNLDKISAGEFNRLRLALLAARVELGGADERLVLFLDEIDANVSGEEAASIAKVLKLLAARYQIFAISHQSQLTSKADCHYLVTKQDGISEVRALERHERIREIARIISGEAITDAALEHAAKLLEE